MDLRKGEEMAREEAAAMDHKSATSTTTAGDHDQKTKTEKTDSGSALQSFLNRIPIASIPGIHNSPGTILELKSDECLQDAISLLFDKIVSGAPILDYAKSDFGKFVDRDIGFIDFSSMILWTLEEFDKPKASSSSCGFFETLEQVKQIGHTKIVELAKSFVWEPFFPVHSNDTLFHVQLLLAKHHRLRVAPVVESSNSCVIGFVTQYAVMISLLKSRGLEWFDQIAEKPLSQFGFAHAGVVCVYADQTLAEALRVLWEKQLDGIPVVDQESGTLVGNLRCSDIYLLLKDNNIFKRRKYKIIPMKNEQVLENRTHMFLFKRRKSITVVEFIITETKITDQTPDPAAKADIGVLISVGILRLKNTFLPPMNTLVTNRKSDTLKQAMENLVVSKSDCSFLADNLGKPEGVVTLRDFISQFLLPSVDSSIDGGGFFKSALEQAGCHVEDGLLVCNQ